MPEIKILKEEILTMLIDAYNDGYFDCDDGKPLGFNRDVEFWESEIVRKGEEYKREGQVA